MIVPGPEYLYVQGWRRIGNGMWQKGRKICTESLAIKQELDANKKAYRRVAKEMLNEQTNRSSGSIPKRTGKTIKRP